MTGILEGILSSGYVTNVTGTLFRMRNTFCWTARIINILSAFAHSTASLSFHLSMRDSPSRLRIFFNQPDVYGVASFVAECLSLQYLLAPFWFGHRPFSKLLLRCPTPEACKLCNLNLPHVGMLESLTRIHCLAYSSLI